MDTLFYLTISDSFMKIVGIINWIIGGFFFLFYFHQIIYLFIGLFIKKEETITDDSKLVYHRFRIIIAARNEEQVIPILLDSIYKNTYPKELYQVVVIADNCTDNTAFVAKDLNALVIERNDLTKIGKGYALNYAFNRLHNDIEYQDFDAEAYIVLDADNILTKNYIYEMNKAFNSDYEVITSYRNSQNFGENWISSGCAMWFLHEAQYLNYPRNVLGVSAAISGTGFLIKKTVVQNYDNWDFFFLTEDVQFTAKYVLDGKKIGYAQNAIFYDEQPTGFKQSWRQRERWSKGWFQVMGRYYGGLTKKAPKSFSCFDIVTTIFPAFIISSVLLLFNIVLIIIGLFGTHDLSISALHSIISMLSGLYSSLFVFGLTVVITEWKKILAPWYKKVFYLFTFPLFMFTFYPIGIGALFKRVTWKQIKHQNNKTIDEIEKKNQA